MRDTHALALFQHQFVGLVVVHVVEYLAADDVVAHQFHEGRANLNDALVILALDLVDFRVERFPRLRVRRFVLAAAHLHVDHNAFHARRHRQ